VVTAQAKISALERELDRIEALDELRSRHGTGNMRGRRGGGDVSATAYGALAGAGGMLVVVITIQWLWSGRNRRGHQAFVPVRYINHPSFSLVGKRL
jgi:hypothetical protein